MTNGSRGKHCQFVRETHQSDLEAHLYLSEDPSGTKGTKIFQDVMNETHVLIINDKYMMHYAGQIRVTYSQRIYSTVCDT